jgi:hypothetical protein
MSTLAIEMEVPFAENVTVSVDTLCVDLSDGRSISVPVVKSAKQWTDTEIDQRTATLAKLAYDHVFAL